MSYWSVIYQNGVLVHIFNRILCQLCSIARQFVARGVSVKIAFDIPTSVERLICSHMVINVDLSITFQFNDDIWLICVISVGDMILLIR